MYVAKAPIACSMVRMIWICACTGPAKGLSSISCSHLSAIANILGDNTQASSTTKQFIVRALVIHIETPHF